MPELLQITRQKLQTVSYELDPRQNDESDPDPNQNGLDPQSLPILQFLSRGVTGSKVRLVFMIFFKKVKLF